MGGTTYLFFMVQVIVSTTEDGMRAMIQRITTMAINMSQGDNLDKVASKVCGAHIRLEPVNKVPRPS